MLIRFNKRTIVFDTIYNAGQEATIDDDIAQSIIAEGNAEYVRMETRTIDAHYAFDANGNVTGLLGPDGSIHATLGLDVLTVGNGGKYATIQAAVDAIPDTLETVSSGSLTITKTNGSADIVSASGKLGFPGALVRFGSDTRYYKIKFSTPTGCTLYETYQGTSSGGPVSMSVTTYWIRHYTVLLLPGHHLASAVLMRPGIDIVGVGRDQCSISELASTPSSPLSMWGENNVFNVSFRPDKAWLALDGVIGSIDPDLWAGAESTFMNVMFHAGDLGAHGGGSSRYPVLSGGVARYLNCEFRQDHLAQFQSGGKVTATSANTLCIMNGCLHVRVPGYESKNAWPTGQINPTFIITGNNRFDIVGAQMLAPDLALNSVGNVSALYVGASSIVNMSSSRIILGNTGTPQGNAYAIEVTAAGSTVNLENVSIDAAGSNATGVYVGAFASTVNIRAGSRVKGTTNSINAGAGSTVNVSGNADLIGATTGAGTINLATAT